MFQNSVLMKYRPFFYFLQRHAGKTAHEVQKVYINTSRWYYETGFRRYVRALDNAKISPSLLSVDDPQAETLSGVLLYLILLQLSLFLVFFLLRNGLHFIPSDNENHIFAPTREEIMTGTEYASAKDDDVTLAFQTSEKNYVRAKEKRKIQL